MLIKKRYKRIYILFFILHTCLEAVFAQNISPLDFGLSEAKTDKERYDVLLRTHLASVKTNCGVSYEGVGKISIEIPEGAGSIPLTGYTDFSGAIITVNNNFKDLFLFALEETQLELSLTKEQFLAKRYKKIDKLKDGTCLLFIEDQTPWVENRKGYDYGAIRRDVILIDKGQPKNQTIQPYNNEVSKPVFRYCKTTKKQKVVKNLVLNRTPSSSCKTFFIKVACQNNIGLYNITINTPATNSMHGDCAISIQNSTNVVMTDITLNGTYSQKNKYGYGINLNNVWNSCFERIKAHANWGVFGNYNVNYSIIKNCDINRFDVHCYGRDIYVENTSFCNLYNQFSSVYGVISFKKCEFQNCIPVLIDPSFNAYTPFELIWKDCVFYLNNNRSFLVTLGGVSAEKNQRPELTRKSLPDITIKRCKVVLDDTIDKWYVIWSGGNDYRETFDGIEHISIKGLNIVNEGDRSFSLISEDVHTTRPLRVNVKRSN